MRVKAALVKLIMAARRSQMKKVHEMLLTQMLKMSTANEVRVRAANSACLVYRSAKIHVCDKQISDRLVPIHIIATFTSFLINQYLSMSNTENLLLIF